MTHAKDAVVEGKLVRRPESGMQEYGSFDLGVLEGAEKELPSGSGKFYETKTGKNVIRFIPPLRGKPAVKVWSKHFFSAGSETKAIICPKAQANQPCALCKKHHELMTSNSRADQKQAKAYQPRASVYVNIIDMKEPEKGVQVFRISSGLFKDIRKAIDNADVGGVFADPVKGFNIIFTKEGSGFNTEYGGVVVQRQPTPLDDELVELIAEQPDLETIEALPTDEEQDDAVDGEFEVAPSRRERDGGKGRRDGDGRGREREPGDDDGDIAF